MQKWEYMTILFTDRGYVVQINGKESKGEKPYELLNRLGAEGWEAASGAGGDYLLIILKRPKE